MKKRADKRKASIENHPLAKTVKNALAETSCDVVESGTYTLKIQCGNTMVFSIEIAFGSRTSGMLVLKYNPKVLRSGSLLLTQFSELVEAERMTYAELADKYGRVLIPEEAFEENVREKGYTLSWKRKSY